jgi:branched-chain amino acid transport system ATP-binding protein
MRGKRLPATGEGQPVLACRSLIVGYGSIPVVHDINLELQQGEVVALLGPNGAGKSTLLKALSGVISPISGSVELLGRPAAAGLAARSRAGLGYVPEGRSIFPSLSTAENLRLGRGGTEAALKLVPALERLLSRRAGLLSGGEQQFLTLARAIAAQPAVLLADELSLGLAPILVQRLMRSVREAADQGLGVILVEQHVRHALAVADRVLVLRRGRVVLQDSAENLKGRIGEIEAAYLADSVPAAASQTEAGRDT